MPHPDIKISLRPARRHGVQPQCNQQPSELQMDIELSDLIVGLMMTVFGVIGLVLASGATDDEMYLFGLSLAGFAVIFDIGLIRRHYDRREARHRGTNHV